MKFNVSGHHVDITSAINEAVESKFSKVVSHYPDLVSISVILTVERNEQRCEATAQFKGAPISTHASHEKLYSAIAATAKKLETALSRRKGTLDAKLHEKPELSEVEETYAEA